MTAGINRMKLKNMILGILCLWASVALCAVPDIHLSGTMKWQSGLAAYIDGEIYTVNDEISGYRIIRIDEYGMVVQKEGKPETYYVGIGDAPNVSLLEESESLSEPATPASNIETKPLDQQGSVTFVSAPAKKPSTDIARGILAILCFIIGFLFAFVGGIWFLVEAFRAGIWWGLGCLFISVVELIFLVIHWDRAAKPFGLSVLGGVIMLVGIFAAPGAFEF